MLTSIFPIFLSKVSKSIYSTLQGISVMIVSSFNFKKWNSIWSSTMKFHLFLIHWNILINLKCWFWYKYFTLREKCPYSEFFWSVFSRVQFKCRKIRTTKTPNKDTFHAVSSLDPPPLKNILRLFYMLSPLCVNSKMEK